MMYNRFVLSRLYSYCSLTFSFPLCQCLMYLYHYPDIWYDYATWHAKSGSIDSAIKVFQRALKALPGIFFFLFLFGNSFHVIDVKILHQLQFPSN